jgi:hypothetical protein
MKAVLPLLMMLLFILGCGNNSNKPATEQGKDTTTLKDSSSSVKYNPASPPAENSQ